MGVLIELVGFMIVWFLGLYGFIQPALGLLLYSRIPQREGGRLFDRSAGFFYGNSCNSGTESRKIVPKVGN